MGTVTPTLVRLSRGYVAVTGPEAADFLERMVSNEVALLEPGEARPALLLTPKGRIVAPHISFTKGCYPGQEPIARLHYRGHPNRRLRVVEVDSASPGDEILHGEKAVGR